MLFWKQVEYRSSGRRYEGLAGALSRMPGVSEVYVLTPPVGRTGFSPVGRWKKVLPLSFERRAEGYTQVDLVSPTSIVGLKERAEVDDATLECLLKLFFSRARVAKRILWMSPDHAWAARIERTLAYDQLVVDCVDEMPRPAAPRYPSFARMVSLADKVVTTSPETADAMCALNPTASYLPNGVDNRLIRRADTVRLQRSTPRRIGYVGVISARTDVELLHAIALEHPEAELVLVGWLDPEQTGQVARLQQLSNVKWTGRVPFTEVPLLIDSFDVCIVPHLDNALMRSQSALKLYQYLARGKPVVSTPINDIDSFADVVHIARSRGAFLEKLRDVLREECDTIEAVSRRLLAATDHTWEARVKSVWGELTGETSMEPGGPAPAR